MGNKLNNPITIPSDAACIDRNGAPRLCRPRGSRIQHPVNSHILWLYKQNQLCYLSLFSKMERKYMNQKARL